MIKILSEFHKSFITEFYFCGNSLPSVARRVINGFPCGDYSGVCCTQASALSFIFVIKILSEFHKGTLSFTLVMKVVAEFHEGFNIEFHFDAHSSV